MFKHNHAYINITILQSEEDADAPGDSTDVNWAPYLKHTLDEARGRDGHKGGYKCGEMHHHNMLFRYGALQTEIQQERSQKMHIAFRSIYCGPCTSFLVTSRLIDGLPGNKTLFSVLMTNAIEIRELINRPELEYIMKTLAPLNAPEDIVIQIVACLVFMTYLEDGEGLANKAQGRGDRDGRPVRCYILPLFTPSKITIGRWKVDHKGLWYTKDYIYHYGLRCCFRYGLTLYIDGKGIKCRQHT
ncbi:uncharacterized protein F5891DRAFT_984013 [Suillus fuscotomentosus]|uniref:Uncharacterized protein n=1 Tax=Suillus fuscotomentosus TaxID=1912939 RepID=A0AAD4HHI5_9AGAM|nr:uncharacterized protein F5891DRAFT_984013 [Suillus fuscotomentosus]KAG1895709.1 hypothetical protein F5891DRAFT_984013 [Suillus fuscotomentosus]